MTKYIRGELTLLAVISVWLVQSVAGDCWWSGCQSKSWAERGCFPASEWKQVDSKPCEGGDMYQCCSRTGDSQNPPATPAAGPSKETGICSWYGADGEIPPGHPTACGEGFDRFAKKVAHKTLPCGTRIRVKNEDNGRTVDVTVNDRGPFTPGRILDLTYGAFADIELHDKGVTKCSYKLI